MVAVVDSLFFQSGHAPLARCAAENGAARGPGSRPSAAPCSAKSASAAAGSHQLKRSSKGGEVGVEGRG